MINASSAGDIVMKNCVNVGIETSAPTAKLDVHRAVPVGQLSVAALPSATGIGHYALIYLSDDTTRI